MSINELLEIYKQEFCDKCKNKNKEFKLCSITIHEDNKTKEARCYFYEEKRQ